MSENLDPHSRHRGDSDSAASTAARGVCGAGAEHDDRWALARPVVAAVGRRAAAPAEVHHRHDRGARVIDALLHPRPGRRFALTGQVVGSDGVPATGVKVTLYVDRMPRDDVFTDGFGEFDFPEHGVGRVGLRVGPPETGAYVELGNGEGE